MTQCHLDHQYVDACSQAKACRMSEDPRLSFYEAWDLAEQQQDGDVATTDGQKNELKEENHEEKSKGHRMRRKRKHRDKWKKQEESVDKEKKEKKKDKEKKKRHVSYDSDIEHEKSSSVDEEALKRYFEAMLSESSETEVDEDAERAFYNSHNMASSSSATVKTEEEALQEFLAEAVTMETPLEEVPKDFSAAPWNKRSTPHASGEEAAVPIAKAPAGSTSKSSGAIPASVMEGAAAVPLPPLPPPSFPPPASSSSSAPMVDLPRGKAGPKYEGYYYSMFFIST